MHLMGIPCNQHMVPWPQTWPLTIKWSPCWRNQSCSNIGYFHIQPPCHLPPPVSNANQILKATKHTQYVIDHAWPSMPLDELTAIDNLCELLFCTPDTQPTSNQQTQMSLQPCHTSFPHMMMKIHSPLHQWYHQKTFYLLYSNTTFAAEPAM